MTALAVLCIAAAVLAGRKAWRCVAALALVVVLGRPASADCGEERVEIKLGTDVAARDGKVDPSPAETTIAELVAQPRPRATTRRAPAELKTWLVRATITGYKLETDGDYHVVIVDERGRTMIVEIPDPKCAASGAWAEEIAAARKAFEAMVARPTAKLRHVQIPVVVMGVGFFDKFHGQTGVARNGIELHPVLHIDGMR